MYWSDELFTHPWESYFSVYIPGWAAMREINTKITLKWMHKQFTFCRWCHNQLGWRHNDYMMQSHEWWDLTRGRVRTHRICYLGFLWPCLSIPHSNLILRAVKQWQYFLYIPFIGSWVRIWQTMLVNWAPDHSFQWSIFQVCLFDPKGLYYTSI